ncbi:tyrosine-type recombinase/integrase [Macrococcoides canis]|nr:tyrosine-type recombinase/integrase [Macrococcus canis]
MFTTSLGSPVYIHKINKLLKTVTDKSSFKHKRITSHALRQTHITTLAGLGLPLKAIMELVGHTSEKNTIQLYTHVTDQMAQDLINKLNEHEKKMI